VAQGRGTFIGYRHWNAHCRAGDDSWPDYASGTVQRALGRPARQKGQSGGDAPVLRSERPSLRMVEALPPSAKRAGEGPAFQPRESRVTIRRPTRV